MTILMEDTISSVGIVLQHQNTNRMPATRLKTEKPAHRESRLSYRLRRLTTAQRRELMQKLGLSKTTLYARMQKPGSLTLDEADTLRQYLEGIDNEAYDIYHLLREVDITA